MNNFMKSQQFSYAEPEFRETFSKSSKSRLKKLKLLDGESEMSRSKVGGGRHPGPRAFRSCLI